MSASLVGSEMCIRDRLSSLCSGRRGRLYLASAYGSWAGMVRTTPSCGACLLYTSDAADDM
eukprot:3534338-Alexandrium_andersonii.AAC.1